MLTHSHKQPPVIEPRFGGLPQIAHGGYVSGVIAGALRGRGAEIRLRRPIPPGRPLVLHDSDADLVELRDGDILLADGTSADLSIDIPRPVRLAEAEAATHRFPGHERHTVPGCVVCGSERGHGDGLRIFPGPVAGRRLVAAPWVPAANDADEHGHVPDELVWAALDCPQLWALMLHAPASTADRVVTAAMAARLEQPVVAGEPHVVVAWPMAREGRKWIAGAAIFGPDGELSAVGRQTAATVTGWGVPLGRDNWGAAVAA